MNIRENIKDVAKLSENYQEFWTNVRARLKGSIDLVRPETINSLWAMELQRRNQGLSTINRLSDT